MRRILCILIISLFVATPVLAETIYIWTDENGVKRFSNVQPEGVENYETARSIGSEEDTDDDTRPGLKKMVNDVEKENRAADQSKAAEQAREEREDAAQKQAEQDAKNEAERARLQKKIDEINNRALSPTFTQGMRDNQIEEIQKQIDALE